MIETLQAENAALTSKATAADGQAGRLQGRLRKVENQLDRFRAKEFRDRVMQGYLRDYSRRRRYVPGGDHARAPDLDRPRRALHKEPFTPATLRKKMDVRVSFNRYFESRDEG